MIRKLFLMAALPAIAMLCGGALAAPTITSFGSDGLSKVLASHSGRPFVLLVWSLDCTFCHASMKNLAAAKSRKDFDVVAVAIESAEDPGNAAAMSAATAKLGKGTSTWAFGDEPIERIRYKLDPQWHGELPRSYWFNAKGERIATHSGLISPSEINEVGIKLH